MMQAGGSERVGLGSNHGCLARAAHQDVAGLAEFDSRHGPVNLRAHIGQNRLDRKSTPKVPQLNLSSSYKRKKSTFTPLNIGRI